MFVRAQYIQSVLSEFDACQSNKGSWVIERGGDRRLWRAKRCLGA